MEINQKGILIVLSGPSGSGKSTVMTEVRKNPDFALSVSLTTRKARPGEIDGVHYYFVSQDEFNRNLEENNLLEHTEYCGNCYGTPENRVNELLAQGVNVVLEIETEGALNVKSLRPDAVLLMIIPPSFEILEKRLRSRGTNTEEEISKRLARAREELALIDNYDYVAISEDGKTAQLAEFICSIADIERHKIGRNPDILSHFYQ